MRQYCRYCDFCFKRADGSYYCSTKGAAVAEARLAKLNSCHDFVLSDAGDVVSGKKYKPRKTAAEKAKIRLD